jgi:hypothetical protein
MLLTSTPFANINIVYCDLRASSEVQQKYL